jgi:hypothetical protein
MPITVSHDTVFSNIVTEIRGVGGRDRHTTDPQDFATSGKKRPTRDAQSFAITYENLIKKLKQVSQFPANRYTLP